MAAIRLSPSNRIWLARVIGLAALYYLSARLGQVMAILPGNVTAFWPPSGLALSAMISWGLGVWPGVWIGSFAFNLGFFSTRPDFGPHLCFVAATMACGASLQGYASLLMARRYLRGPDPLEHGRNILRLLALGGPVGCLIAPTVGVTTMSVAGVVPWAEYWHSWWTWWLGDTTGVLLMVPLMLVWTAPNRRPGFARLIGVACLALTLALWQGTRAVHDRELAQAFTADAGDLTERLTRGFARAEDTLYSIRSFFVGSQVVERHEFRAFTEPMLGRHPSLLALSWNPLVTDDRRDAFERDARLDGVHNFRVTDRDERGRAVPSPRRPRYMPILYLQPSDVGDDVFGFDPLSAPDRRAAIERAIDTGLPGVTPNISLVQVPGQKGILLILPVYSGEPAGVEQRRASVRGVVIGVFMIERLVQAMFAGNDEKGIDVTFFDESDGIKTACYTFVSPHRVRRAGPDAIAAFHREGGGIRHEATLEVGGRRWRVVLTPTDLYEATQESWLPLAVLIFGFTLSALLMRHLALAADRNAAVQAANQSLTAEIAQRREVEHRLRDLYDTLPDMHLSIDIRTKTVTDCNRTLLEKLGLTCEEVVGRPALLLYRPESRDGSLAIFQSFLRDGEVRNREMMLRAKDGRILNVVLNATALRDASGGIIRGRFVWRDVSDLKNAQRELDRYHAQLEETVRTRTAELSGANAELALKNTRLTDLYETAHRFVDDVSHEFRTPLTVIKGYVDILLQGVGGPLTADQGQWLRLVSDRTRDLAQMVDDLLDTSRLRAGLLRVDRRPVPVQALLDRVLPTLRAKAEANRVMLDLNLPAGLPHVFADAEKAGRVLVNLVINAIKFTAEGGTVVIWAEPRLDDGEVALGVTDTGPGIGEESLRVIFERFRQVGGPQTATGKGFGLGLNIAKELVTLNLGDISVISKLRRGSTFTFTMPIHDRRAILEHYLKRLADYGQMTRGLALIEARGAFPEAGEAGLCSALASRANPLDLILAVGDGDRALILRPCDQPTQAVADWQSIWDAPAHRRATYAHGALVTFHLIQSWATRGGTAAQIEQAMLGAVTHAG